MKTPLVSRVSWLAHAAAKARVLRRLRPQDSVAEYLALGREFSRELEATDKVFRKARAVHLADLQAKLRRLEEKRGNPVKQLVQSVCALQARLTKAGIPSMVIGGVAVSLWGEPRLTRDVDLKVLLERGEAGRLLRVLGKTYRPLDIDPRISFAQAGFAFFLDSKKTRIDLLLADNAFDEQALSRAVLANLAPRKKARVCTAEDLVIYKLISERPRDQADAESILARQGSKLDDAYIKRWLRQFEEAPQGSALVSEYRRMRWRLAG